MYREVLERKRHSSQSDWRVRRRTGQHPDPERAGLHRGVLQPGGVLSICLETLSDQSLVLARLHAMRPKNPCNLLVANHAGACVE